MRAWPAAAVALVLACACETSSVPLAATTPSASPSASGNVAIVFQARSGTANRITLARADGSVIKALDIDASGLVLQGQGAALRLFGANVDDVLAWDGAVTPVPASVQRNFGSEDPNVLADPTFATPQLVIGTSSSSDSAALNEVDLQAGVATQVVVARLVGPRGGGVLPPILLSLGIDDFGRAQVLIRHADYGTVVSKWGLLLVDLKRKVVVSTPQLSALRGLDPFDVSDVALSRDNRWLAYQEGVTSDASNRTVVRTHILDLSTGKDTIAADTTLAVTDQLHGLSFSPDGTALAGYGQDTWPDLTGVKNSRLLVLSTSDGRILENLSAGDATVNEVRSIGWSGPHTLIYSWSDAGEQGPFTTYRIDAHTGDRFVFGTELGQPIAVLNRN